MSKQLASIATQFCIPRRSCKTGVTAFRKRGLHREKHSCSNIQTTTTTGLYTKNFRSCCNTVCLLIHEQRGARATILSSSQWSTEQLVHASS